MTEPDQAKKDAPEEGAIKPPKDNPYHEERERARRELGWCMIQEVNMPDDGR